MFPRIDNGHVLGVAAFSVPVIGAYAPLGLAPLIILAAMGTVANRRFRDRAWPNISGFAAVICALAMIWPVTLALWRRSPAQAIIGCLVALALVSGFASSAAILAVAAGILCCALTFYLPRVLCYIVAFGVLAAVFAGPFVSQHVAPPDNVALGELLIPNSAHHRLLIWQFTADKIAERPLLGWDFNSSKTIPGNTSSLGIGPTALPLHPHNVWLQWWLELGVVGAIFGAVLIGGTAWRLREPDLARAERTISLALLVAMFLIGGVAYGAWQSWWIAAILFAVVFMAGNLKPPAQSSVQRPTGLHSS